ncbi:MAG: hypothetical protein CVU00_07645 [Bacteroidetes bacterium HGW-Bacteroidetes-17]|nr:MAG: hypothetical protein CVU00_07645 [Bacteroidetes bacterium HGW-Bacteroidetes-17]
MKKNLIILSVVILSSFMLLTSCKKDEVLPDAPIVNAPAAAINVDASQSVAVTFNVVVPGGFSSASVSALNGTAVISTKPEVSATTGNVEVSFTAGNTAGAGSITLTVTDKNQKTDDATAIISVAEEILIIPVTGNITTNTTWETGKTYILQSRIAVVNGVTLTIQPGVIVKGAAGSDANATALIIAQGGKINAVGTATQPIIFTSVADQIEPGQIASPNLNPTLNGLWGGLIVLGKAHISYKNANGDSQTASIEGIPANDPNGIYGGTLDADNSGVIKYISIRHGGTNIGEGNEINGLTLGGVGSGTVIENVEVISNQDDGIEFFGGTVNVKNALLWNIGDDALDTDQAFAGTVDNFVIINPGDECFELDGPEGTYAGAGHTIKNGIVSVKNAQGLIDFDASTDINMMNIYFRDLTAGQDVEEYDVYSANTKGFASSAFQVTLPAGSLVTDFFKKGSDAITTSVAAGAATVGADLTKFNTWTWASVAGQLTGL